MFCLHFDNVEFQTVPGAYRTWSRGGGARREVLVAKLMLERSDERAMVR